ncbi:hypothetical protein DOM21_14835 [Bacteriovorax stolpii]|uniref:hypothetical protein n=1 Tax=Bacteriovorax stolpii TaxID=960 RepID=UPI0011585DA8|nr:hypothetical protein [Bacteriovorax stolpii]QDK42702.1 hypothetical protein DOM21_14835 [Bacteriovorax stolpii]
MENADSIEWNGDSEQRFQETVIAREVMGDYQGNKNLGQKLASEAFAKIKQLAGNLNLHPERENSGGDRVAPLASGYIVIYRKVYYQDPSNNTQKVKLVIHDIRKSY